MDDKSLAALFLRIHPMRDISVLTCALVITLALGLDLTSRAQVSVTETPSRVVVENESVRLAFNPSMDYSPTEFIYKQGSGQNLISDGFILYYQFTENGRLASVNEGTRGGISNGHYRLVRDAAGATVEFSCDTPHFHMTRRVTLPPTGSSVKFIYELKCIKEESFSFYLPYAPLSARLNRLATSINFIGSNGIKTNRIRSEALKSPTLNTGSYYGQTDCYYSNESGEGIIFTNLDKQSLAGISQRATPRFKIGSIERNAFVMTPFKGDYKKALISHLNPNITSRRDSANSSTVTVLRRTPDLLIWADHATRKVFPAEMLSAKAPMSQEVSIEAARGEYEPFQIVLRPSKKVLADVKLVPAALTDNHGHRITAQNLKWNPIGSLRSSYGEDIPDLLLQKSSISCQPGQNSVLWVTVKVPDATLPGVYRGTLQLTSGGIKLGDIRVRLRVWNFALSPTSRIRTFATDYVYYYDGAVDLNNETDAKARALPSKGTEEEVNNYDVRMRFFADHRIYETGFGPRPNYAGAIRIPWKLGANGVWDFDTIDFTAFDKARAYCYNTLHWPRFSYEPELAPYLGFINQFTFGGKNEEEYWYMRYWDPVLPKKDPKKYLPSIYDLADDFTPVFKEKLLRYIKTIADHCRAKGICIDEHGNGPVFFIADEIPDYTSGHAVVKKTLELARLIKHADPRVILVVNGRDIPDDPEILNLFDLWTARAPVATLAKLHKMGKRYGDYYMHSNFNLRDPAIQPRVQFWSYWKYDFFWIGDWAMTMTPDQRWYGSQRNFGNNWWFPSMTGKYGEPMSTIRFELMREGLEDHEYLCMLSNQINSLKKLPKSESRSVFLARGEALLKRADAAGGNYIGAGGEYYFDGFLRDPIKLLALRHDIGEFLGKTGSSRQVKR